MQVRNKIGVKSLNLNPTPTPENFDFVTPAESESGFGVQCRVLVLTGLQVTGQSQTSF